MPPGAQFQIALGADGVVEDLQIDDGRLTLWIAGAVSILHRGRLVLAYGPVALPEQDAAEDAIRETDLAALDELLISGRVVGTSQIIGSLRTLYSEEYQRVSELLDHFFEHPDAEVRNWVRGIHTKRRHQAE